MKRFNYRARDKETGKIVKGAIQAENERTAGKLLVEQGYFPESISEEDKNSIINRQVNFLEYDTYIEIEVIIETLENIGTKEKIVF